MHWQHYLLLTKKTVHMMTDYYNFKYFCSTKELNGRQAREEYLSYWTSRPRGHVIPPSRLRRCEVRPCEVRYC